MSTYKNTSELIVGSTFYTAFILVIVVFVMLVFVPGCDMGKESIAPKKGTPSEPIFPDAAFSIPGMYIVEAAGDSAILSKIRETGLLVVSLDCDRPLMCSKNKYGIPRGFEVDLLRQFAYFLGAKLNVVGSDRESMISGPAVCGADTASFFSTPYFYSSETGWLCLKVEDDPVFADVFNLVLTHIYETGAYQQLFMNWFKKSYYPEKSEGEPAGIETQ